jgi:hypothetical protein
VGPSHYRVIAGILRRAHQRAATLGEEETVAIIADELALMLKMDNIDFNQNCFMDDIYGERI